MANEKHRYRFTGASGPGEVIDRVILRGTVANPEIFLDVGQEMDMTEAEAAQTRKDHKIKLVKISDDSNDQQTSQQSAGQNPKK